MMNKKTLEYNVMKNRRVSEIWSFFTPSSDYIATCDLCKSKFTYLTSVTNLKQHMKQKHSTAYSSSRLKSFLYNTINELEGNEEEPNDSTQEENDDINLISPEDEDLLRTHSSSNYSHKRKVDELNGCHEFINLIDERNKFDKNSQIELKQCALIEAQIEVETTKSQFIAKVEGKRLELLQAQIDVEKIKLKREELSILNAFKKK